LQGELALLVVSSVGSVLDAICFVPQKFDATIFVFAVLKKNVMIGLLTLGRLRYSFHALFIK
jgi:hypothetical protein